MILPIQKIENAVGRRGVISGVRYEPASGLCIATDGHILVTTPVTPDKDDQPMTIPAEAFKVARRMSSGRRNVVKINTSDPQRVRVEGLLDDRVVESAEFLPILGQYINWQALDYSLEAKPQMTFDLALLEKLISALKEPKKAYRVQVIAFSVQPSKQEGERPSVAAFACGDQRGLIAFRQMREF